MSNLPHLFLLVRVENQPLRAVFHGTLEDEEVVGLMKEINTREGSRISLSIYEKYKDGDDSYRYTILTLSCEDQDHLENRLDIVYPDAMMIEVPKESSLRDIVRSIVIRN